MKTVVSENRFFRSQKVLQKIFNINLEKDEQILIKNNT